MNGISNYLKMIESKAGQHRTIWGGHIVRSLAEHIRTLEKENEALQMQYNKDGEVSHLLKQQLANSKARVEELSSILDKLIAWDNKYPSSRIYNANLQDKVCGEIQSIIAESRKAVRK